MGVVLSHNIENIKVKICLFLTLQVSFAVVVGFLICWMPYSIFSFWYSFFPDSDIPIEATVVPALLAKSSSYINPIIYVVAVKKYRTLVLTYVCRRKGPVQMDLKTATPHVGFTVQQRGLTAVSENTLNAVARPGGVRPASRTVTSISSSQRNPLAPIEVHQYSDASVSELRTQSRGLKRLNVASSKLHETMLEEESEIPVCASQPDSAHV